MNRPGLKRSLATLALVALVLPLADCGRIRDSKINPFNWFGHSRAAASAAATTGGEAADGRQLIPQLTGMAVEKILGGAIVRATGLPPTQGWWKAALVADNHGRPVDGVLTYRFLVFQPQQDTRVSTPQSREITAAAYVSDPRLAETTKIVIEGGDKSLTSKR